MRNASHHRRLIAALLCSLIAACVPASQAGTTRSIGHTPDAAALAAIDIDVAPDGTGLPAGSGAARAGAQLFAASCARCHGASVALGHDRWLYATSIFDYVRRAMPPRPATRLTSDETYALTAYLLAANGIVSQSAQLDRASLPHVVMPDAADFVRP